MKNLFLLLFILPILVVSQSDNTISKLYDTYDNYKEITLDKRRIKHADISPLIDELELNSKFKVTKVGTSIGGKELSLISIGSGAINVFLWSQMHGDEPTATQALFDIINFLDSDDFKKENKNLLSKLTLHFLPMLNPDGADLYQRRNLLGVDINRDALRLQSPEAKTLKRVRDSLKADFGFNLHDQSTYYNAERTDKPATISYLAPAYNYEKDINEVRGNAMKIIVFMNAIIQKYAPGQVGRYNDDFEPRAFGDNIQKWGTSTILIESGGYAGDTEKQEIRKLNYVSILSAIYSIANSSFKTIALDEYEKISQNDRKLFDLKIKGATYVLEGKEYLLDLGINQLEVDTKDHSSFWYSSRILDQGDLSTYYGYENLDATGYTIVLPKVYPDVLNSTKAIAALDLKDLLRSGFGYLKVGAILNAIVSNPYPLHFISENGTTPIFNLVPGQNPTFFLEKNGVISYAVINGFLINLNSVEMNIPNAMIYR